jgi:hypothetical protein
MRRALIMVAVLTMAVPALARAETAPETTVSTVGTDGLDNTISAFGLFSYWYANTGIGVGARYQKTIVPAGVLHLSNVHDDIGLEGGIDYYHYSFSSIGYDWSYNEAAILVGAVWNFWFLNDRLALYPKIDVGFRFGSWSTNAGVENPGGYGGLVIQGAAGIAYRLNVVTLRAEAGSGSVRLGVGFAL